MNETLQQITDAAVPVVCLLISAAGLYLVALFRKWTAQAQKELDNKTASKYMGMACDAVTQAVAYTAQTFVDTLKEEGAFTKEKQLEAFTKAKSKTKEILGSAVVAALGEVYGDFDAWLDTKIEQVCREIKTPETNTSTAAATAAGVAATIATTAVQQLAAEATCQPSQTETE